MRAPVLGVLLVVVTACAAPPDATPAVSVPAGSAVVGSGAVPTGVPSSPGLPPLPPPPAPRPTAIAPLAPDAGYVVPVDQVDTARAAGLYAGPITADISGTELTITVLTDNCTTVRAGLAGQDATRVDITLTRVPVDGRTCAAVAAPTGVTVTLDAPVGDRRVTLTAAPR